MSSAPSHALAPSSGRNSTFRRYQMNIAHSAIGSGGMTGSTRRVHSFFKRYWGAFQERRKRERLRADLSDLNDWELQDIGITRGEIDYVASNRSIDPRANRSAGPMNV